VIGLDTNILVRYFAQDDPAQAAAAEGLIEGLTAENPGFVSTVALVEAVWVLSSAYKVSKDLISTVITGLLNSEFIVVENTTEHYEALQLFNSSSCDFADAVIAKSCRRAGCERTVTFDRRAAAGAGMTLLTTTA
jgi:predicted nucleic-acid-binding protein